MEFKNLPLKVQEIAAQCLADKICFVSGFAEGAVKNEPAKDQARQVREAFIELYCEEYQGEEEAKQFKLYGLFPHLRKVMSELERSPKGKETNDRFLAELKFVETQLK
ncbi:MULTISPECIES: hypothetical protein [Raoultella]|uniref:hypothetical protein n=1 Tax=Raoultella TaxID=160674 RepID=UPI0021670869|nr:MULTISPECIES: hypothetical protein [Raoultella]MCS4271170.1 hypothetical protein [Raoultella sp. BIGb0132]MCS4288521.1 hypothetical protein [Raoultella terrigena]